MLIRPITAMFPSPGRSADSLLILSSSFERRCLGFAERIGMQTPPYRVERTLLLSYADQGDQAVRDRVRRYIHPLNLWAEKISLAQRVEPRFLHPYEITTAFEMFLDTFRSVDSNSSVVVDISTLTKLHLFYILEAARASDRISSLRLAYTRARYGRYDTLSWGAEEPIILPMFGQPRLDPQRKDHLLMFCGLEPDRCYSVWRRFGQGRCTQVFIDSGEDDPDRCADRAVQLNNFDPDAKKKYLPAFSVTSLLDLLMSTFEECQKNGEYLYIAPLATKWEVVGIWKFFSTLGPEIQAGIVYAAPGRLNVAGHTLDELGECVLANMWG